MTERGAPRDRGTWPAGSIAAATFVVAVLFLLVVLRRGEAPAPLAERVIAGEVLTFEEEIRAALPRVAIRPTDRLRVRAARVEWRDPGGERWLDAPRMEFSVRVSATLGGAVVLENGVVDRPRLRLVQHGLEDWNFQRALAPLFADARPARPGEAAPDVRMSNIRIRDGQVELLGLDAAYTATEVQVDLASAVLSGPGITEPAFHVRTATGMLAMPGPDDAVVTRAVTAHDARLRLPGGVLAFQVARMTFGTSVAVNARGVWDPGLGGLGLDLTARIEHFALTDIPWLREEAPEDAVASFDLRIEPLPGDRSSIAVSGLALRSETSVATGSLRAVMGPAGVTLEAIDARVDPLDLRLVEVFTGPLPYVGQLRGTVRGTAGDIAFDGTARLATSPLADPFTVEIEGRMALTDPGPALHRLVARFEAIPLSALRPVAPGLPLAGPITGTVRLDGLPGDAPVQLDVRLEAGGGIITVAGTLDLRGAIPAYDVTGRLIGVELQRVLEPAVPPVQVDAGFSIVGRGLDLATAESRIALDGRFTGWRAEPGDTVSLRVQLASGQVRAEDVRLTLGPVALAAAGDWRFTNGVAGAIRYALRVESLEPLGPYLPGAVPGRPVFARGSLAAEGTLTGSLDAPRLEGRIDATAFRYDQWAAERLEGEYQLAPGPGLPQGTAELTGRDIRTPGADFDLAELTVEITGQTFAVDFRGDRPGRLGLVELGVDGRIDEIGDREVVIHRAALDLDRQRWHLPAPARVQWTDGDRIVVTGLRLDQVDGDGLILLEGILSPADETDIRVDVAALPIGDLLRLVLPDPVASGELWLSGTVRGPGAAPEVDLRLELRDGVIQQIPVALLAVDVTFQDGALVLDGNGLLGDAGRFTVEGAIPVDLQLGLPPSVALLEQGAVRLRFRADAFPLATLDPGIRMVRDIEGYVSADVLVAGTMAEPRLSGGAALTGGAVTVPLLDQRYEGIEGLARLDDQVIRIDRLVARSGGTAGLSGTIHVEELTNPTLDLVADLREFRAQGVPGRRDAAVTGQLRLRGPVSLPVLSGSLRAEDGTIDITMLQEAPRFTGELIGIGERFDPMAPMDVAFAEPVDAGIRISRLDVTAGNDLWFQAEEVRVQLTGDLTIEMPGTEALVTGLLTGNRGTFNLRIGPATRRFDIVEATLRFFGTPDPDPAIDITAERVVPGANRSDFVVRVRVTGSLGAPAVAFATEDGVTIPEAEALNFLIFGRATATLADFPGGFGTTQGFYDALAFYGAFDWLSAALAEQLGAGIDHFQIQMRSGTAETGPEFFFVLGQEVASDVFLLVTLPTAEFAQRWAVSTEWRIDRQWTLQGGYEPPDIVIGTGGRALPFAAEREQQFFLSIRRRWSY